MNYWCPIKTEFRFSQGIVTKGKKHCIQSHTTASACKTVCTFPKSCFIPTENFIS